MVVKDVKISTAYLSYHYVKWQRICMYVVSVDLKHVTKLYEYIVLHNRSNYFHFI